MLKLNLGCGDAYLDGWVNIDLDSEKADLRHDLTEPLPYEDGSVDLIYSEHFIEHLTAEDGLKMLRECHRVLKPGGLVRVATVDLDYLVKRFILGWKRQDWIKIYGYEWLQTKAEMLNMCFHEWGHKYLYNKEELQRRFREAGFKQASRKKWNKSSYDMLSNRETRKDSRLIIEGTK